MELTKLQTIALVVLTTIITDKYLIYHPTAEVVSAPVVTPTVVLTPTPASQSTTTPPPSTTQNEVLLKELQNLRKDMTAAVNDIKTKTDIQEPLPTSNPSLIGGMVKISSPQWKRVDVYEKALTSSKIINSISYDTIYFYRQKVDGWYQLDLDGGQSGWTQSQFLKEYP